MYPQVGWRLITAPTDLPFDLEEAKDHLRVTTTDQDSTIYGLIQTAVDYVAERDLLLCTQVWEMTLYGFPCAYEPIRIHKKPVQSVAYVNYVDTDGASQAWDTADWRAALTLDPPQIIPAYSKSWPTPRIQSESVTIGLTLGYNSSPQTYPFTVIAAMKLLIGHLFMNREAVVDGQVVQLPIGLEDLLDSAIKRARVY